MSREESTTDAQELAAHPRVAELRSKKLGLVLAGGGGRGAYQIGCWRALSEVRLTEFEAIAGASVGALHAAAFAVDGADEAEELWRRISPRLVAEISILPLLKWLVSRPISLALRNSNRFFIAAPILVVSGVALVVAGLIGPVVPLVILATGWLIVALLAGYVGPPSEFEGSRLSAAIVVGLFAVTGFWFLGGWMTVQIRLLYLDRFRGLAWRMRRYATTQGSLFSSAPLRKAVESVVFEDGASALVSPCAVSVAIADESTIFDPDFPRFRQTIAFGDIFADVRAPKPSAPPFLRGYFPRYVRLNGMPRDDVVDVLLASTALPEIFPRQAVADQWVTDGGVVDNVPILPVADSGCDAIIVIYLKHRRALVDQTMDRLRWLRRVQQVASKPPASMYREYVQWLRRTDQLKPSAIYVQSVLPAPRTPYIVPLEREPIAASTVIISVVPSRRLELFPGSGTVNFFRWHKRGLIEQGRSDMLRVLSEYTTGVLSSFLADQWLSRTETPGVETHEYKRWRRLERILGEDHEFAIVAHGNFAQWLRANWHLGEAVAHQEATWQAFERTLGPEHRQTLIARGNLGNLLLLFGDLDSARSHQEAVVDALERRPEEDERYLWVARDNLAEVMFARGELSEALLLRETVTRGFGRIMGDRHPNTLLARGNLARTLMMNGFTTRAHAEALSVWQDAQAELGPTHPYTLSLEEVLADALVAIGQPGESRAHRERIWRLTQERAGWNHPATVLARLSLSATREVEKEDAPEDAGPPDEGG